MNHSPADILSLDPEVTASFNARTIRDCLVLAHLLTYCSPNDCENTWTSFHYLHSIGSINHRPFVRVMSRRVGACGILSKLSNITYVGFREGHVDYFVVRIRLCGLCDWLLGYGLLLVFREIINRTDLCFANRVLKVSIWWKWKYTIRWLFTYEFEQHSPKGSFKINAQDNSAHFCQKLKLKLHLGHDLILKYRLTSIGNPIVDIRRSYDRLISTMLFPLVVKHLYIESGPWSHINPQQY